MRPTLILFATAILTVGLAAPASSQSGVWRWPLPYQSSFEANDFYEAEYVLGDLHGQGELDDFAGWQVDTGSAQVIEGPLPLGAADGVRSVHQGENSRITAEVPSDSSRMIIRAWHSGEGTQENLIPPEATTMAAAVLGFESAGEDQYIVKAFDGPGNTGQYVAPDEPLVLSSLEWNKIVVSVNYATQTFDVAVNNQPYLQQLNFFNPAVTSFTGFQASSQAGAYIDLVGFFQSDGDYDGDGIGDDLEMRYGGDPLDPNITGPAGDVNQNGSRTLVDAFLYYRAAEGTIPSSGLSLHDYNFDDEEDTEDAEMLFEYVTNLSPYLGL